MRHLSAGETGRAKEQAVTLRMLLKRTSSIVLASLKASTYLRGYASAFSSLPPRWNVLLNSIMSCRHFVHSKRLCCLSLSILAAVLFVLVGGCAVPLEEQKAHIRKHHLPFHVLSAQAFLETWGKPTYAHHEKTQFYPVKTGNYVPRFRAPLGEPPPGWDASIVSEPAIFLGYVDRGELLGFIDDRLVYREQMTASQIHEIGRNWQHEAIFKTRLETDGQGSAKP